MNDIATVTCLMFAFTSANHLGLISKAEEIINHPLPILNCPMCSTFWSALAYLMLTGHNVIGAVAMSFFFAYLALWVELAMCGTDYLYSKIYEKITEQSASDEAAADTYDGDAASPLSHMRKDKRG